MKREAGVLLPISSLPGPYGIGCFSEHALRFLDWLQGCGQSYWQILPLGPTGYGDSPYQSFSTFAGNPYFIDLEDFIRRDLLTREECAAADFGDREDRVDYAAQYRARYPLLRLAFSRDRDTEAVSDFARAQADWLPDYTLFMALKGRFGGRAWGEWPEAYRLRDPAALERAREELSEEIAFQTFLQAAFFRQWDTLHRQAAARGVRLIGDIPIYVAMDSADVWAHPELFDLDEQRFPTAVAGCPPDGFSATGQLWGNPLYLWQAHRAQDYDWWCARAAHCFRLYDVLRIDHFRGFDEYYAIPSGAQTAAQGTWRKGPGLALFQTLERRLGRREVIAEDLGYVTDSVRELVRETGFPGMKVLEFAFDSRDTGAARDYLPHNYEENCVVYTGTHDNETVCGWLGSITPEERQMLRDYLCDAYTPDHQLYRPFTALALRSRARLCVIPMQDYLGLGNESRMNRPSTLGENWRWRVTWAQLDGKMQEQVRGMTARYGRLAAGSAGRNE